MKKAVKVIIGIIVIGSMLQNVYAREGTFQWDKIFPLSDLDAKYVESVIWDYWEYDFHSSYINTSDPFHRSRLYADGHLARRIKDRWNFEYSENGWHMGWPEMYLAHPDTELTFVAEVGYRTRDEWNGYHPHGSGGNGAPIYIYEGLKAEHTYIYHDDGSSYPIREFPGFYSFKESGNSIEIVPNTFERFYIVSHLDADTDNYLKQIAVFADLYEESMRHIRLTYRNPQMLFDVNVNLGEYVEQMENLEFEIYADGKPTGVTMYIDSDGERTFKGSLGERHGFQLPVFRKDQTKVEYGLRLLNKGYDHDIIFISQEQIFPERIVESYDLATFQVNIVAEIEEQEDDQGLIQIATDESERISVPDTLANVPWFIYVLGMTLIIIGCSVMLYSKKRNRFS